MKEHENYAALNARAYAYIRNAKLQQAIPDINKAIQIQPNEPDAYQTRGILYLEQKKYNLALEDLNKAIKLKPNAEAFFYRGAIKDIMKDKTGACEDLKKAASLGHEEATKRLKKLCGGYVSD